MLANYMVIDQKIIQLHHEKFHQNFVENMQDRYRSIIGHIFSVSLFLAEILYFYILIFDNFIFFTLYFDQLRCVLNYIPIKKK